MIRALIELGVFLVAPLLTAWRPRLGLAFAAVLFAFGAVMELQRNALFSAVLALSCSVALVTTATGCSASTRSRRSCT